MKLADISYMFKKTSTSVCMPTVMLNSSPMSPTPTISSAMKIPENKWKDPDEAEPLDE